MPQGTYTFGPFSIDSESRLLFRNGERLSLPPKAADVLIALLERQGQLVTKDDLLRQVWPDTFVEEGNLARHIFVLRQILGDSHPDATYIETVPKRGYRFAGPIQSNPWSAVTLTAEEHTSEQIIIEETEASDPPLKAVEALTGAAEIPVLMVSPVRNRWLILPVVILALAFVALVTLHFREESRQEAVLHVPILPPEDASFTQVRVESGGAAVSPDGRAIAFVATAQGGKPSLWVRPLDSMTARPLSGTENAYGPFWSPDSRFIGFFAEDMLRTVAASGGPPQVVCEAALARGGTWSSAGVIVFSAFDRTLYRVSAAGGKPVKRTALDPAFQEFGHYWPAFLPDGRRFLYLSRTPQRGTNAVAVGSIDGSPGPVQRKELIKASSNALYVPGAGRSVGWLLFLREKTLYAQPFDASTLKLTGKAVPVAERVGYLSGFGYGDFSASHTGVLVYGSDSRMATLAWSGRDGRLEYLPVQPGEYLLPRLSPDESRLAVSMFDARTGNPDLWQVHLQHLIMTRFTFDPGADYSPVWSPDGKQIVFSSVREGPLRLFVKPASGAGNEVRISEISDGMQDAFDWSPDGQYILGSKAPSGKLGYDLWLGPLTGDRKPTPFLQTEFSEVKGRFSPDGRWVAYVSNESGRFEIYVRNFTGAPAKYQISSGGGLDPHWSGDGKELFYLSNEGKMMAAVIRATAESFQYETPKALFDAPWLLTGSAMGSQYDVTRDGRRLLVVAPLHLQSDRPQAFTLVTNWLAGLRN